MLKEKKPSQNQIYCGPIYMQHPEQAILWRQKLDHRLLEACGWEWVGKCEMSANAYIDIHFGMRKMFLDQMSVEVAHLCEYIYFKNYTVYLNRCAIWYVNYYIKKTAKTNIKKEK